MAVIDVLRELLLYMKARRKWFLAPLMFVVVIVGGLLLLAQGSALAPFIYTIF